VTRLVCLSPGDAGPGVTLVSPLQYLELGAVVHDVSHLGKLEVRGDLARAPLGAGDNLISIGPRRGLLITEAPSAAHDRLSAAGLRCYDLTAAFAGLELEGEPLLRRLTELDLERLPAVGPVARGVAAVVQRLEGERFRLFVPQELGGYVAEVVLDLAQGLGR
jgi:hypothetical protein